MTKKSDAPAIRFKGFSDAWEQRKLGELVDRVVRKNTNNESTLPLTISAQYGLVDQITYFNNRVASRDVSNYYLVLNGEFAYNKSTSDGYPFGAVKRLDLYEKGVLSTLYIVFAPKKEQQIDSDYLTVFFDTDRWHKGVAERAAEGARNHGLLNISAEDFFDIDLSVPKDIVEQKQIGAFIRQLDNLITLHQRKFEKLTNVKKSMLEKMFPQNGSSYPEIRFKGFTDPWEQRKLAELTKTITTGKSVNSDEGEVSDGDIGVLKTSCVSYDRFNPSESKPVVKSEQQLVKCAVEKDSVIVSRMNTPERVGACGYVSTDFPNLFLPDRLWKLKFQDTVDTYFVYMMLVSSAYKEKITSMASGTSGSMYNIPKETFLNLQLVIPAKIDEQKQLGRILKKIDSLITLHQRKLEKLQNIKKSCLEKMFV